MIQISCTVYTDLRLRESRVTSSASTFATSTSTRARRRTTTATPNWILLIRTCNFPVFFLIHAPITYEQICLKQVFSRSKEKTGTLNSSASSMKDIFFPSERARFALIVLVLYIASQVYFCCVSYRFIEFILLFICKLDIAFLQCKHVRSNWLLKFAFVRGYTV